MQKGEEEIKALLRDSSANPRVCTSELEGPGPANKMLRKFSNIILPSDLAVTKGWQGRKEFESDWCSACSFGTGGHKSMFTIFDLYYILGQKIHSLHYILRQARGVLAMDGGTSSDPYCKVVVLSFNSYVPLSLLFLIIALFPITT